MEEIIKSVKEAEERALKIKEDALARAGKIAEEAEAKSAEILNRNETDCKLLRETGIRKAEKSANIAYGEAISRKKDEAKTYADGVIKRIDPAVNKVVGRITGGSC